jgi:hypothetical protein
MLTVEVLLYTMLELVQLFQDMICLTDSPADNSSKLLLLYLTIRTRRIQQHTVLSTMMDAMIVLSLTKVPCVRNVPVSGKEYHHVLSVNQGTLSRIIVAYDYRALVSEKEDMLEEGMSCIQKIWMICNVVHDFLGLNVAMVRPLLMLDTRA